MLLLNSFIFLFLISISALVIPSMLPNTTTIGILLLLFGLVVNLSQKLGRVSENKQPDFLKQVNYSNLAVPILGLLLLFFLFTIRSFSEDANIISNAGSSLIHLLFLFFIVNTREYIKIYIKAYVYFVLIMSISGLIATLIVSLGFVDAYSNYVNISDLTNGSFTRDANATTSYLFPYNLGLILTGGGKLELLGYEFFRISGWAHEPTSATLFVVPSLILLIHTKVINNSIGRFSTLLIISTFWFFSMSVGSFLALIILYSFVITLTLYIKIFPLKLTSFTIISFMLLIGVITFYVEPLLESSLIYSKFDFESETFQTAVDSITWFLPDASRNAVYYFSFLIIWSIIFLFSFIVLSAFVTQKDINVYALILLYIVIHTMKGSQTSVYTHLFTFFWFYMAYFSTLSLKR